MKVYSVTVEIETEMEETEVHDLLATALNNLPEVPYLEYFDLDVSFDYEEDNG